MLREILPQVVVLRLDRGIPLSIFQNGAAEGEETWDEPIMRQRKRPPQQHGRHADADPSMSQLVHARRHVALCRRGPVRPSACAGRSGQCAAAAPCCSPRSWAPASLRPCPSAAQTQSLRNSRSRWGSLIIANPTGSRSDRCSAPSDDPAARCASPATIAGSANASAATRTSRAHYVLERYELSEITTCITTLSAASGGWSFNGGGLGLGDLGRGPVHVRVQLCVLVRPVLHGRNLVSDH
jgi:hypothetical protein